VTATTRGRRSPVAGGVGPSAGPGQITGAVGLVILLGTIAMLFAAMLFAYAVVRLQAPSWPPPETPPFPRGGAAANGLLLLATSVALRAANRRRGWAAGALALGTGFLVAQLVLWRQLVAARLGPGAGALGDVFFALSALHAAHVLGGLIALGASVLPGAPGRRLRLTTIYWDFLLVVWLIIYVAVCLT
jgi:cytochrome c oxidase subunit 3